MSSLAHLNKLLLLFSFFFFFLGWWWFVLFSWFVCFLHPDLIFQAWHILISRFLLLLLFVCFLHPDLQFWCVHRVHCEETLCSLALKSSAGPTWLFSCQSQTVGRSSPAGRDVVHRLAGLGVFTGHVGREHVAHSGAGSH